MKISKNNYEAFFLDYHEGNLSDVLKKEVLAFVDSNPDLRGEFESFEIISLTEKPVVFPGKEKLKRNTINEYNYKTWFVAYEENDLDQEDKNQVEQFIKLNPVYKPELEILKQTKILPDFSIRFENKSSLKKVGAVIPLWVRFAAAACLLIGLLSYWMIQQKPKPEFVNEHNLQKPVVVPLNKKESMKDSQTIADGNKGTIEKNNAPEKAQRSSMKRAIENKVDEHLANMDSVPVLQRKDSPVEEPLANNPVLPVSTPDHVQTQQSQTRIIINENQNVGATEGKRLVVLDDNDLAELGLKATKEENKSLLADAVNGVGKIFNVNAHYDKEHNPLQSKYTETLALGPVAITRTVAR